jgi:hypothetical protein
VHVVQGHRTIPSLQNPAADHGEDSPESIALIEAEQEQSALRYQRLEASPTARRLRSLFTPDEQIKPQSLQGLVQSSSLSPAQLLSWLDLLSGTKTADGIAFTRPPLP